MIVDADCIQFELGGDKKVIVGGDFTFLLGGIASSTLGGIEAPGLLNCGLLAY